MYIKDRLNVMNRLKEIKYLNNDRIGILQQLHNKEILNIIDVDRTSDGYIGNALHDLVGPQFLSSAADYVRCELKSRRRDSKSPITICKFNESHLKQSFKDSKVFKKLAHSVFVEFEFDSFISFHYNGKLHTDAKIINYFSLDLFSNPSLVKLLEKDWDKRKKENKNGKYLIVDDTSDNRYQWRFHKKIITVIKGNEIYENNPIFRST